MAHLGDSPRQPGSGTGSPGAKRQSWDGPPLGSIPQNNSRDTTSWTADKFTVTTQSGKAPVLSDATTRKIPSRHAVEEARKERKLKKTTALVSLIILVLFAIAVALIVVYKPGAEDYRRSHCEHASVNCTDDDRR